MASAICCSNCQLTKHVARRTRAGCDLCCLQICCFEPATYCWSSIVHAALHSGQYVCSCSGQSLHAYCRCIAALALSCMPPQNSAPELLQQACCAAQHWAQAAVCYTVSALGLHCVKLKSADPWWCTLLTMLLWGHQVAAASAQCMKHFEAATQPPTICVHALCIIIHAESLIMHTMINECRPQQQA